MLEKFYRSKQNYFVLKYSIHQKRKCRSYCIALEQSECVFLALLSVPVSVCILDVPHGRELILLLITCGGGKPEPPTGNKCNRDPPWQRACSRILYFCGLLSTPTDAIAVCQYRQGRKNETIKRKAV